MSKEKTIYNLDLHESMIVIESPTDDKAYPCEWQVTRVPSGWFYRCKSLSYQTSPSHFFVPFDNCFQN